MDNFYQDDELRIESEDTLLLPEESMMENQTENLFGIKYKENMFSEPSQFNYDFFSYQNSKEDLLTQQQSCISFELSTSLGRQKPLQFPPCRCHKIKCQKRYCECFRNGRRCTKHCICTDCCNQPTIVRMKVNIEQLWQVSFMFRKH